MTERKKNILIYSILGAFVAITIACFCCINLIKVDNDELSINCVNLLNINVGESQELDIKCSNENAEITISTSDNDIIEINNFNVIGLTEGTAYINIEVNDNKNSKHKNIKVVVKKVEEESTPKENIDLNISLESETTIYLLDKNYTKANADEFFNSVYYSTSENVKYSISKENIIIISSKKTATGTEGKITARSKGEVVITFYSTEDESVTENRTIKVETITPNITIPEKDITLTAEDTKTLNYSITPVYYSGTATITIESSDEEVFTVEHNANSESITISGIKKGQANLNVYLNGELDKSINVNVEAKYVPTYSLVVTAIQDCTINNKEIHSTKNSCAIQVKVINDKSETMDCVVQISGIESIPVVNYIVLNNLTNCTITFSCSQYEINENYSIIVD